MNDLENRVEIQERIEHYIQGKLTSEEVDELWIKFIESPEWYEYFMTLLNLYSLGKSSRRDVDFFLP